MNIKEFSETIAAIAVLHPNAEVVLDIPTAGHYQSNLEITLTQTTYEECAPDRKSKLNQGICVIFSAIN